MQKFVFVIDSKINLCIFFVDRTVIPGRCFGIVIVL